MTSLHPPGPGACQGQVLWARITLHLATVLGEASPTEEMAWGQASNCHSPLVMFHLNIGDITVVIGDHHPIFRIENQFHHVNQTT
jgi:hypothetical protein